MKKLIECIEKYTKAIKGSEGDFDSKGRPCPNYTRRVSYHHKKMEVEFILEGITDTREKIMLIHKYS